LEKDILYGLGKAANAGGVAVSGLEMAQNALFLPWSREEVDMRLQQIMESIFENCQKHAKLYGFGERNLHAGANIAGFLKVANAMISQGHY
jgi:glutamate dehydrogenase (NADP+)